MKQISILYLMLIVLASCQKELETNTGTVKITFVNKVKSSPLVLNTETYTNPFNEAYTISKFKYYISNINLNGSGATITENNSYHLVDAAVPASMSFSFETGVNSFSGISFMIGVDSARNSSGAQTGALDPLNDMFWTWNSGYVMAKMEGNSPQSSQVGNRIEYHIGGFKGINGVLKTINLSFPAGKQVIIKEDQTSEIIIEADLDSWWHNPNDITIANQPVSTDPGVTAKKIADNYSKMFTVTDILNN